MLPSISAGRAAARLALAAVALAGLSGRGDAQGGKPDTLRVGTSGTLTAAKGDKDRSDLAELRKFIESETTLKSEVAREDGWQALADKMARGEVHVGVFQGYEFAWAKEKHPKLQPLALAVNVHRYPVAYLVAKAGGPAAGVAGLKGQSLSVAVEGQPYLKQFVDRAAGAPADRFFSKVNADQHAEDALDDVVDGVVAAAAADQAALEAFRRRKPGRFKQLKPVAHSKPFPPPVLAVYDDVLDAATRRQFADGLFAANRKEAGQTILTLFKLTGFEAPPADFDKVLQETREGYPPPAGK